MVAVRIEIYDTYAHRRRLIAGPQTTTRGIAGAITDLDAEQEMARESLYTTSGPAVRVPPGMLDQDLSAAAAEQMERILQHRLGQPTRPASDLPTGDISSLRRRDH